MKTIGVIGSRSRDSLGHDLGIVKKAVMNVYEEGDMLVSGGASAGADRFAEMIARTEQIPIIIYYAKWKKYGMSAGFQRNGDIAEEADILVACVNPDRTGGTEDTIKKFIKDKDFADETAALDAGKLILV
jgi:hypothetical protein